ncbi:MAG: hypothetical protein K0R29_2619 [Pseudobdellovibrio sp.]|nr:hypothetical protein [Pseudobdellovibrio sp.]
MVNPTVSYSGFFKRFGAAIIDGFILLIPTMILGGSVSTVAWSGSIGLSILLQLCYYPIFESSRLNATPGKAILGIAVVSESGETLTFKAAVIRLACRYLSIATCYIGYIMQLFTKKRQTLHDILSEAVVIDRESPDINYFTVWTEQFKAVVNKL